MGVEEESEAPVEGEAGQLDFHDLLKAKSLSLPVPIQFVRPITYDPGAKEIRKKGTERRVQDPATRAWNFFTALYYKAGGTPWRLARDPSDLASCFVGISFYRALDGKSLSTSVAQVFNERGQGIILTGGPAEYTKDDPQPHLPPDDAYNLLKRSLQAYRDEHETTPAHVVIHKSSLFSKIEREAMESRLPTKESHVAISSRSTEVSRASSVSALIHRCAERSSTSTTSAAFSTRKAAWISSSSIPASTFQKPFLSARRLVIKPHDKSPPRFSR